MKNLILLIWMAILVSNVSGQSKKETNYLDGKDLVGVWQRNFQAVGNGLQQNFRFFPDGKFEVHFADEQDDARDIYQLKGTYRLVKNALYLTIRSRVVYENGKMEISGSNEDGNIFQYNGGVSREIPEPDPKECSSPIYLTIISKENAKLDNEVYFKVSAHDLKAVGINPADFQ